MYVIRKTFHALAAGTRVELVPFHYKSFEEQAHKRGGYVTVKIPHMTKKFLDQNSSFVRHVEAQRGAFDIEADNVVKLRDRHVSGTT